MIRPPPRSTLFPDTTLFRSTHAVLSGPAIQRIKVSHITKLVVLDTIPLLEEKKIDKIEVLSVAKVFAQAINIVYKDAKMSEIYDK